MLLAFFLKDMELSIESVNPKPIFPLLQFKFPFSCLLIVIYVENISYF